MRIIAGTWRGRTIASPTDKTVRPTSDKVRGAIFNILVHGKFPVDSFGKETRVLDAFCGSGALGLEALSRGGGFALFLDNSLSSLALAKANAQNFKAEKRCSFEMRDLSQPQRWNKEPFHLLFLDPPYRKGLGEAGLKTLTEGGFVASRALAVVESAKQEEFALPSGWVLATRRNWGATAASFLVYEG